MKKLLLLLKVVVLAVTSGCSDDDSTSASGNNLIKQATATGYSARYNYSSGGKIESLVMNGQLLVYEYTGNLITKWTRYSDESASEITHEALYLYNADQRLISETLLAYATMTGYRRALTYNSDGTVSCRGYAGDLTAQNNFVGTDILFFTPEGDVRRVEEYTSDGLPVSISEYLFDAKHTPFKNVIGFDKLVMNYETGIIHNAIVARNYNGDGVLQYERLSAFTYDSEGYPLSVSPIINTVPGETTTYAYW